MPFKKITTSQIAKLLLVVLAVAIQIQITLFESDDYLGLRINLADLIIPFTGLFILTSLLLQKSVWPQFSLQKAYMWLGALGCVLVAALVHSYLNFNTLSMWGLQNKIIGWIVLCSFFLMGGWITSNTKIENILLLLKISLSLLLSIIIVQVVLQTIFFNFSIRLLANDFGHFPMEAFMANKNSFVFLFLTLACFTTLLSKEDTYISKLNALVWFFFPLVFFHTGARSALVALPFIALLMFFYRDKINTKQILIGLMIGILCCVFSAVTSQKRVYSLKPANIESISHVNEVISGKKLDDVASDIKMRGDSNRLKVLQHVFSMIQENPIFGSGLGSILITQEREYGQFIDLMDCTALWLWAETGIFGLGLFLIFYFLCLKTLWASSKNNNASELSKDLSKGAILMLIIFGVMSLFHELLYSRFLWLFLGMMLALPRTQGQET